MRMRLFAMCFLLAASTACGTPYWSMRMPQESAQPAGSRHVQGELEGVGRTKLYWQSWQPTKTPKHGALVIVHGLKDHSSRYAELAHALNEAGYAVYAFDLPGHGYSAGHRADILLFDDYVMDFDIFLHQVQAEEDTPIFVLGHSMGGAIAVLEQITYHPDLRGMILSGAALEPSVSSFNIGLTQSTASVFPDFDVFNLELSDFSRDPAVVRESKHDPLVYQGAAPAHTASVLLSAIRRVQSSMDQVDVPLLILHGKADRVTPAHGSQTLYARARSKDKTLKLYDRMFHDLLHEPEKAQVASDIIAWMSARTR